MDTVGRQVCELRERKGWTQVQLGVYAGISPSTVNLIEHGHRNPNAVTLQKLATALEVEPGDLFGESVPKEPAPPSPEPSFDDVLEEEERREQARVLIPLMDSTARKGKRLAEAIRSDPDNFPYEDHSDFSERCLLASFGVRQIADRGELFPELREAFDRLALVWKEVSELAGIAWGEEGELAYRDLVRAAGCAREAPGEAREGGSQATA